ncbi:MAG: SGNH/GDSL hydrolase family protein [Gammaproteobacteria bacterium]|nr:SGNH/GDSL hydrolase family protein [Gammaproteobacteria bacterium]
MLTRKIILFGIIAYLSISAFASPTSIQQLVIFGDSYSDNGNTYALSKNTYPGQAYYLGHFSDGLNWSEYLAIKLGVDINNPKEFRNFAYGQAQTVGPISLTSHDINQAQKTWRFTVPDLAGEIKQYLDEGDIKPTTSFYFIFIGTNDFLNYIPRSKAHNQKFVANEFDALNKQITRLKKLGAKHIVVFKLRELTRSPLAKQLAKRYQHHYLLSLQKMIRQYNARLTQKYQHDPMVVLYNTYQFDQNIFKRKISYAWYRQHHTIDEKVKACYINQGNYVDQAGKACAKPWRYFYYDRIHPTTFLNKLMADDLWGQVFYH